jgi:ABC-type multidrug transport system ATPase subunit
MSEEILKALMELFALVVKQDGGIIQNERDYVINFLEKQLGSNLLIKYVLFFDDLTGSAKQVDEIPENNSPSVRDSVKILNICKQINRTLNKGQKIVVLIRLYELINSSKKFTTQRLNIISIVSEVFRILPDEFTAIEQFVRSPEPEKLLNPAILVLRPGTTVCEICHKMHEGYSDTTIMILRIASVDLYFIKYSSKDQLYLNGIPMVSDSIYTFSKGSSLRSQNRHAFYYSDVNSNFLSEVQTHKLSFFVKNLSYRPDNRQRTLVNVNFSAEQGTLVGILGASGSGKTTLLNLMSGILKPSTGSVSLNGLDIIRDKKDLEGVMGFVPQDDLLIEELTVFENLYYAACQCFGDKSREEVVQVVEMLLTSLGLIDKRDLKVGNPLNKIISGGQRKRLNIALELIREPSVLFIDEPTSGLSSKDSENIMDLLRDLTLKGKLVFTVIHQPSSDIFRMFDKVVILDQGGYMVYYGNPVDSVIHFKTIDSQINASQGECPSCGNMNPEVIFKILEAQVVDEFGNYTDKRKVKPKQWADRFKILNSEEPVNEVTKAPGKNLNKPGRLRQFALYLSRDFKSKISNIQYVLLTLLEAPVLAFILSFIIRYIPDPNSDVYYFSENENIPIYIFMCIIVALFLGLTISAEEIFHDRKVLKREQFLNLSRSSYLLAKIILLVAISALQSFLFISIANPILEIKGMYFNYWLTLFTTAFCANMFGLIISSSFNSAITIYIVIPLLIIPMMILSGAMFSFDKLNRNITRVDKVPLIAEIIPTRWTYEALMVSQFKDNRYSTLEYNAKKETFYSIQKKISQADFNNVYRLPELTKVLQNVFLDYKNPKADRSETLNNLKLIKNETARIAAFSNLPAFRYNDFLEPYKFTPEIADSLSAYIKRARMYFTEMSNSASDLKDKFYNLNEERLRRLEKRYYNYKLEEIVTKYYEPDKILRYKNSFIQNTHPVYLDPEKKGFLSFRTHFFAPSKNVFGVRVDTFVFNISIIFAGIMFLYIILYYDLIAGLVKFLMNIKSRK